MGLTDALNSICLNPAPYPHSQAPLCLYPPHPTHSLLISAGWETGVVMSTDYFLPAVQAPNLRAILDFPLSLIPCFWTVRKALKMYFLKIHRGSSPSPFPPMLSPGTATLSPLHQHTARGTLGKQKVGGETPAQNLAEVAAHTWSSWPHHTHLHSVPNHVSAFTHSALAIPASLMFPQQVRNTPLEGLCPPWSI